MEDKQQTIALLESECEEHLKRQEYCFTRHLEPIDSFLFKKNIGIIGANKLNLIFSQYERLEEKLKEQLDFLNELSAYQHDPKSDKSELEELQLIIKNKITDIYYREIENYFVGGYYPSGKVRVSKEEFDKYIQDYTQKVCVPHGRSLKKTIYHDGDKDVEDDFSGYYDPIKVNDFLNRQIAWVGEQGTECGLLRVYYISKVIQDALNHITITP